MKQLADANPYSPPRPTESHPPEQHEVDADPKLLARPATVIMTAASLNAGVDLILSLNEVVNLFALGRLSGMAWLWPILFALHVFQAIGADKMVEGKSFHLARIAMILACIPIASPFGYLGAPFGFWGLSLLRRPQYRTLFPE